MRKYRFGVCPVAGLPGFRFSGSDSERFAMPTVYGHPIIFQPQQFVGGQLLFVSVQSGHEKTRSCL